GPRRRPLKRARTDGRSASAVLRLMPGLARGGRVLCASWLARRGRAQGELAIGTIVCMGAVVRLRTRREGDQLAIQRHTLELQVEARPFCVGESDADERPLA